MATSKTKTSPNKSKVEPKLTDVAAGPTSPENGKKAQVLKGKDSYTVPVKTKTTDTEFTIINH